jgi:hypothetical protein
MQNKLRTFLVLSWLVLVLAGLIRLVFAICPAYDGQGWTNVNTGSPLDSDQISGGAACIRQTRAAGAGAMEYEHYPWGEGIRWFGTMNYLYGNNWSVNIGVQTTNLAPGVEVDLLPSLNNTVNGTPFVLYTRNTNNLPIWPPNQSVGISVLYQGQQLLPNMIQSGIVAKVVFDGTNFELLNPAKIPGVMYYLASVEQQAGMVMGSTTNTLAVVGIPTSTASQTYFTADVQYSSLDSHAHQFGCLGIAITPTNGTGSVVTNLFPLPTVVGTGTVSQTMSWDTGANYGGEQVSIIASGSSSITGQVLSLRVYGLQ